MFDAVRTIDAISGTQCIKRMLRSRMTRPGERQRVDSPGIAQDGPAAPAKLVIEKAHVELRIVRDQDRIPDELQNLVHQFRKQRFVRQELRRKPVDGLGFGRRSEEHTSELQSLM